MFSWSYLLFPFSLVFGLITLIRNKLYDIGLLNSYKIPVKSIVVGNLSVGGTGKTPHVFYISQLLAKKYKTAILSRGYGRNSKGFMEVYGNSHANLVGDEPLLLKSRLENVDVVVCESRKVGIQRLLQKSRSQVIVLDDAYQHRKVNPGLSILLTEFHRPFFNDFPMPAGRLREFRSGQHRADVFIVTKCPDQISEQDKKTFLTQIGKDNQKVFFSKIVYSPFKSFSNKQVENIKTIFLITAIADDSKIVEYLSKSYSVKSYKFRDHHTFSEEDITKIHLKFEVLPKEGSIILTTEKDFVKLKEFDLVKEGQYPWYFLPIDIEIDRQNEFNQLIEDYVGTV